MKSVNFLVAWVGFHVPWLGVCQKGLLVCPKTCFFVISVITKHLELELVLSRSCMALRACGRRLRAFYLDSPVPQRLESLRWLHWDELCFTTLAQAGCILPLQVLENFVCTPFEAQLGRCELQLGMRNVLLESFRILTPPKTLDHSVRSQRLRPWNSPEQLCYHPGVVEKPFGKERDAFARNMYHNFMSACKVRFCKAFAVRVGWSFVHCRLSGDDEMNLVLLRLLEYLGHPNPFVSAIAYTEVRTAIP